MERCSVIDTEKGFWAFQHAVKSRRLSFWNGPSQGNSSVSEAGWGGGGDSSRVLGLGCSATALPRHPGPLQFPLDLSKQQEEPHEHTRGTQQ